MIGLAVLEFVASKIDGLTVGTNCFYEDLPIDFDTGQMTRYGIFVTTEPAPMTRTTDRQQFLTFYVAIGEGAKNTDGTAIAEKYETDRILDAIQTVIIESLDYADELCELSVTGIQETYSDVRLELTASKERGVTLSNGAIVKSVVVKVIYKN